MTQRAVILAAGRGSRLGLNQELPKPLQPVGGVALIVRIIRKLQMAGVTDVAVVVGYQGERLAKALHKVHFEANVQTILNDEWQKPNGTSLLKARNFVQGPCLVLMSDHLFSLPLLKAVQRYALGTDAVALGVDFNITKCFDIEDATKVKIAGNHIVRISKALEDYDALDTGVFKVTPALMHALDQVNGSDGCSLSEGIALLAKAKKMHAVDIGNAAWIDVDTPQAKRHAEKYLHRYDEVAVERPTAPVAPAQAWPLSA